MKIVLFDMDGTLTPPRRKMQKEVMNALSLLQKEGYQIGIVTGSNMEYLLEQCEIIFEDFGFDHKILQYYPCNGTKRYEFKHNNLREVYSNDMIDVIGKQNYRMLIKNCINIHRHITETTECPLTGLFFDYRGTMLNWCPIGRLANLDEREEWVALDKREGVREKWLSHLRLILESHGIKGITVKLGGDTSFDIYPTGWDKTYVLRNFNEADEIYFIGDRCQKNGNDKELYDAIKLRSSGESFETTGPIETIDIIKKQIISKRR